MQLIFPDPIFKPCWVTGAMSPTMCWGFPLASFTTLPTTRISNEGYGPGESLRARPLWPGAWLSKSPFRPTVDEPRGDAYDPRIWPISSTTGNICAHEIEAAGSCRMVLHGTIILMPFTVTVPPQSIGSTSGQTLPSSVAAWMKPVESNCGAGDGICCARAPPAASNVATNAAVRTAPRFSRQSSAARGSAPRPNSLRIDFPPHGSPSAKLVRGEDTRGSCECPRHSLESLSK